jgi:hypothetical protein
MHRGVIGLPALVAGLDRSKSLSVSRPGLTWFVRLCNGQITVFRQLHSETSVPERWCGLESQLSSSQPSLSPSRLYKVALGSQSGYNVPLFETE